MWETERSSGRAARLADWYTHRLHTSNCPTILLHTPSTTPLPRLQIQPLQLTEALKEAITQVMTEAKEKNWKYTQTVELHISLKNYNPQKDKCSAALPSCPTSRAP